MYDIYNNGYNIGGKLNITFDSYFYVNLITRQFYITNSVIKLKSKYYNRCNMSDVTMRLTVVVGLFIKLIILKIIISNFYLKTSKIHLDLPTDALVKHLESYNNSYIDTFTRAGYKLIHHLREMLLYK